MRADGTGRCSGKLFSIREPVHTFLTFRGSEGAIEVVVRHVNAGPKVSAYPRPVWRPVGAAVRWRGEE